MRVGLKIDPIIRTECQTKLTLIRTKVNKNRGKNIISAANIKIIKKVELPYSLMGCILIFCEAFAHSIKPLVGP